MISSNLNGIIIICSTLNAGDLQCFIQRKKSIDETTARQMFKQVRSRFLLHIQQKSLKVY